jgi:hypothetical protein
MFQSKFLHAILHNSKYYKYLYIATQNLFFKKQEHLVNDDCFRRMHKFNGLLLLFAEVCKYVVLFHVKIYAFKIFCTKTLLLRCLNKVRVKVSELSTSI